MNLHRVIFIVLSIILSLVGCSNGQGTTNDHTLALRVSAASSLTNVMVEIKNKYEEVYPNQELIVNFASSGTLAYQLAQGAPTDIYISASQHWMKEVISKGLMDETTVTPIVKNRMVLVGSQHTSTIYKIEDLAQPTIDQLAIGDPGSVPAGKYAKEILESYDLWRKMKGKTVYGKNVRQVAAYVESGNVPVGLVYMSDLKALQSLRIMEKVDEQYHSPILYPIGVTSASNLKPEAQTFVDFLKTDQVKQIFQAYGFESIN